MLRGWTRAAWLPVVLCLLLTAAATALVHRAERIAERAAFASDVLEVRARIHERMESYMTALRAGAGVLSQPEPVKADEFHRFVDRLRLTDQYPGTLGIGYSRRFDTPDPARATAEAHELGWDVTPWPDTPRDEVHAIVLLEPMNARNRAALGYDMHTEATRRDAMDRARDTGDVALSGKVTLVQEIEPEKQPGFLLYSPVYTVDAVPRTVEQRRATLKGFVYAPLRAGDLFEGVLGQELPGVAFELYDGYTTSPETWLYASDHRIRSTSDVAVERLPVAGRVWTARFERVPLPSTAPSLTLVVAALGILLSAVVLAVTLARDRAREREVRATATAKESEERLRIKQMFIGILGHDLRSPLNAIALGTAFLRRKHEGDPQTVAMIDGITSSVSRMTRMIEQLLDVTRASLGAGIPVVKKRAELATIVHDTVDEIRRGAPSATIEVETVGDLEGAWDADRLAQVFSNLLGNAIRYQRDEPVRVTVDGTAPDRVVAAVHNAGVIPPSVLPVVFEPFRGSGEPRGGAVAGLGLGLAITRAIVDAHGGTIAVTSSEGTGTTFTVMLPRDGAPATGAAPQRLAPA